MDTMNYFLCQTCIDTEGGQSGAAIFCERKYLNNSLRIKQTVIFGIHVGGSEAKKYNVGTVITNEMLCKIYDICGIKTTISQVDETEMKLNDTWNPLHGQDKKEFKAYVSIDFSVDGIGVAVGFPSGEIIFQQSQLNNPNIKEKPSILFQYKPRYKLIAFGLEATEKYESIKNENILYFDNFIVACHCVRYEDDEKEYKENIDKKSTISMLQAENGEFVATKTVFTIVVEYIKKNIMETLKKLVNTNNVTDVEWILSIPHFWSQRKSIMLQVMQEVGITKQNIVDHTIVVTHPQTSSIVAREIYNFQEGTKYILFDVGEGIKLHTYIFAFCEYRYYMVIYLETSYIACYIVIGNMCKHIYPPQMIEIGFNSVDRAFYDKLREMFGKETVAEFSLKK
eukprot:370903_1